MDLAKDPNKGGPLARSTTRNLILDKALAAGVFVRGNWETPAASAVPLIEKGLIVCEAGVAFQQGESTVQEP